MALARPFVPRRAALALLFAACAPDSRPLDSASAVDEAAPAGEGPTGA